MEYSFWECIDRARPHWRAPWGDGFGIGPPDDLMPADDGNPEGYFELLSIVRANDDLLAHFGVAGTARRSSHTTGPRKTWRFNSSTRSARPWVNSLERSVPTQGSSNFDPASTVATDHER